jgi:regulator of Ty1 transposition protein 109
MPPTLLSLQARLALALPTNVHLVIHHIASDPFDCPALFSPPAGQSPESTICESHFLSASIKHNGKLLQVFALEIYVYTTDTLTTVFVSKADSTGYLHFLNLPKGTPSPIKIVISTFLDYLLEGKIRKDSRLMLSLFARAQNQYIFPGSIENNGKHVLDDRGLIKWWCRVLDPIVGKYPRARLSAIDKSVSVSNPLDDLEITARAHLIVPGCDTYETRAFFPRHPPAVSGEAPRWSASDPLDNIGKPKGLPTRCYIPRFPDDPKARFVIDLDDELPENNEDGSNTTGITSGQWRSVQTLSQFWELMTFRQECSAGRLVGFIWAIFEPSMLNAKIPEEASNQKNVPAIHLSTDPQLPPPVESQVQVPELIITLPSSPSYNQNGLPSPQPSQPLDGQNDTKVSTTEQEDSPKPVYSGRRIDGGIALSEPSYKRATAILDDLDYANVEIATESTGKFLTESGKEANITDDWGFEVSGQSITEVLTAAISDNVVSSQTEGNSENKSTSQVNTLGAGLVRKKKRTAETADTQLASEPKTLDVGLVRKKPKV